MGRLELKLGRGSAGTGVGPTRDRQGHLPCRQVVADYKVETEAALRLQSIRRDPPRLDGLMNGGRQEGEFCLGSKCGSGNVVGVRDSSRARNPEHEERAKDRCAPDGLELSCQIPFYRTYLTWLRILTSRNSATAFESGDSSTIGPALARTSSGVQSAQPVNG